MLDYLAEQSATRFIKDDDKRKQIQSYINQAYNLKLQYQKLDQEQKTLFFAKQIQDIHRQNRLNSANSYVSQAFGNYQKAKANTFNYQAIQIWLNKLHQWALKGYKVTVGLRRIVTGQELIYHIQDINHTVSYQLSEEQYLKLLEDNEINMNYASTSALDKVVKDGVPMADLFKLSVGATKSKLHNLIENNPDTQGKILSGNLRKDVLYQYLLNEKPIKDESGRVLHSRLYELHSQLAAFYEWQRASDGSIQGPENSKDYFFTKTRKNAVDNFINKYIAANMHKDTIAYYKTGDAIQDERTLIENKVGNATISINTIKNAIEIISQLKNIISPKELKKELINLYTYKGKKTFEEQIQKGAYNIAIKNINNLFK